MPLRMTVMLLPVALQASGAATQAEDAWRSFYRDGRWAAQATGWVGKGTESRRTPEGLHVTDSSTDGGSGRMYLLNWGADPARGAVIEARVKVVSCSEPWGVCLLAADGVHEECLTIYPDRLQLVNARQVIPFAAAGGFHTYRLTVKGEDVSLSADGRLMHDGSGAFTRAAIGEPPRNQCGFGSGASAAMGEAVWQWVRHRSTGAPAAPVDPPGVPGLSVSYGETVEIIPDANYKSLFRFRDGRLAVGDRHSRDCGRTWHAGPAMGTHFFEFPDGGLIGLGFRTERVKDGVFDVPLHRSTDGGKTFVESTARLRIPEATGGTGDDGKRYEGPLIDHAIVQCRDGSLLAAVYGYFKTDTVLCPTFPPEWKLFKYRTFVLRSTDRGETWDYWATVAYDPEVGLESFCEADLLTLPNGDILCFMRTGGSGGKFTPLYLSVSRDDGRTWDKAHPIADRGVWPNACRMASGVLAVTYGRPDNWLAFSLDNGGTWVGHTCFHRGASSSYNSVEEVEPGTLLVVHERHSLNAEGGMSRGVVGTFVTVTRQ